MWTTDITYIPMRKGYMYLMAIIDLHSRYVAGWSVSNTMDADWCQQVLEEAVAMQGPPEIINTDQGSQFTSGVIFQICIKPRYPAEHGWKRERHRQFIERLWRSVT